MQLTATHRRLRFHFDSIIIPLRFFDSTVIKIHPVIPHLYASIEGTSPTRLADCLGLDSSKYQSKSTEVQNNDSSSSLLYALDDDERYRGCESLVCPVQVIRVPLFAQRYLVLYVLQLMKSQRKQKLVIQASIFGVVCIVLIVQRKMNGAKCLLDQLLTRSKGKLKDSYQHTIRA